MKKSDVAYHYLRDKLYTNQLIPGDVINVDKLSLELSISRITIREAIKRLENMKLVESIPSVGVIVRKINIWELKQMFLIRKELSKLAIQLSSKKIVKKDFTMLWDILDETRKAINNMDIELCKRLDREFHMSIYKISKADVIYDLLEELWYRSERLMWVYTMYPERLKQSLKEHETILHSLENKDISNAVKILQTHKEEYFCLVLKTLKKMKKIQVMYED